MKLNAIKQKEAGLINDVNRIEKKLTSEIQCSKNLENKLSNVQKDLQLAQKQNTEMQKTLDRNKSTNESANLELQQQLKALQREKEEIIKQERMKSKVRNKKYKFNILIKFSSHVFQEFLKLLNFCFLNSYRTQRFCMKIREPNMLKK